eukprot:gene51490-2564_t
MFHPVLLVGDCGWWRDAPRFARSRHALHVMLLTVAQPSPVRPTPRDGGALVVLPLLSATGLPRVASAVFGTAALDTVAALPSWLPLAARLVPIAACCAVAAAPAAAALLHVPLTQTLAGALGCPPQEEEATPSALRALWNLRCGDAAAGRIWK